MADHDGWELGETRPVLLEALEHRFEAARVVRDIGLTGEGLAPGLVRDARDGLTDALHEA